MARIFLSLWMLLPIGFMGNVTWSQEGSGDWNGLRGNDGLAVVQTSGILSRTSAVELKTRWKIKIGSGYSSVVVADGIALALYTEPSVGESAPQEDVVIGIDAETGTKLWRYSLGPFYHGQNGSFNGPLATPFIHQGRAYGLSARGRLFCLDLKTGEQLWSRELADTAEAPMPNYGFTTSPIVVHDVLIVQVGAAGKSMIGFDLDSGERKWTVGSDAVSSQTPFETEIAGRPIVLAVGAKQLTGVDPVSGEIQFSYPHHGANYNAVTPVPIGKDWFLLTLDASNSIAVELTSTEGSIQATEVWKNRSIRNSYNIPVFVNGNIYAFSTRFLTCVDPESGRAKWKSRESGDGFLIAVDQHLIVSTKKGGLKIAKASPEQYQEVASAQIFDDLVWSVPAYSDDSIFLRSLGEIARVDIVGQRQTSVATDATELPVGATFSKLLSEVDAAVSAEEKSMLIDQFLSSHPTGPIIEDDIVHFVFRGSANDIAVGSDLFGSRQERKMVQVDGTDFHYYSARLPMDQRANYYFLKDFQPIIDPRNPRAITSSVYRGEMEFEFKAGNEPRLRMSWFAMPNWKRPDYLSLPEKMAGRLERHSIGDGESELTIDVYIPPGYDDAPDRQYPVAYIFGGDTARAPGNLAAIIDSINQRQSKSRTAIAPECIVAFISTTPMTPVDPGLMPEIVVPYVDQTFRTLANRKQRLLVGFSFDAAPALAALSNNPELFSACSVQSPMVFEFLRDTIIRQLNTIMQPVRVRVEWGRFDTFNPDENWDMRSMTEELIDEITKNKNVEVTGGQVNDSTGWSSWQNRIAPILQMLNDE